MLIRRFPSGPFHTNAYVVGCPTTREAAIIDVPPESIDLLIPYLEKEQWKPVKILITHSHWDHIADLAALKSQLNIPIYVHESDAPNIEVPGSDGLSPIVPVEAVKPDVLLKGGELIPVGNLLFRVIHTPGHSPGGVCFYEDKENALFAGDTLFKGTYGSLSLPTSQEEAMWKSLKLLSTLPPETVVFPGHGPRTTIGGEPWLMEERF